MCPYFLYRTVLVKMNDLDKEFCGQNGEYFLYFPHAISST